MNWIILSLLAALFIAFKEFFSKRALKKIHSKHMLAISTFFIAILSLIDFKNMNLNLSIITWILLFTKITILSIAWYLFYHTMKKMPLSSIAPIKNFSPAILVVFSLIILHESLSFLNIIGIIIIIIATYLLQLKNLKDIFNPFKVLNQKHLLHLLIAMSLFSISAILDKILMVDMTSSTLIFVSYLGVSIFFTIDIIILKHGRDLLNTFKTSSKLIIPIAISSVIGDTFYLMATAQPAALIALIIPIKRMSTLIDTIIGGRIFHEEHLTKKIVICIIMIGGAVLVTL